MESPRLYRKGRRVPLPRKSNTRNQPNKFVKKYLLKTPLGRMGHENDVANAVVFFSSELSSYITGHNLVVDGGYSVS